MLLNFKQIFNMMIVDLMQELTGKVTNLCERKCPFCRCVEDETHFLIICPNYTLLRDDLLNSVREKLNEPVENFDSEKMLKYFLGNIEIAPIVAKYLNRTMELRKFLIDNPKRYF